VTTVVLIGGFGVPPVALRRLRTALSSRGHDVHVAPLGRNVDCGERSVGRVLDLVDRLAASGTTVTIVGHSRGGQLARVVAVRRPEAVDRLVTVATPWTIGPPDRPGVAVATRAVKALRRRGIDVLASIECATGPCCTGYREDVRAKPAATWTALWSSADRIAGDDARPPAEADDAIDLGTGHLRAVLDGGAVEQIADAVERRR
jgi:pimeloyl-ACP methyl ester carboxylesterase